MHNSNSGYSRLAAWLVLCFLFTGLTASAQAPAAGKPPQTRADNVKEVIHGVEIVDPYRWLEDQNSPETRAWIDVQNAYTESIVGNLPGREKLKQRITELAKVDVISAPTERGGRYFFTKRLANQDLFVHYLRRGLKGKDEILIDPHSMSPDHTTSVSRLGLSKDGKLMAYGIRKGGQDEVTVHFMDVDTRKDLPDVLPSARYLGISLKPDKSGLYYAKLGREGSRLYYHAMGAEPQADPELFGKGFGPENIVSGRLSENGRHLLIHVSQGPSRADIYYQDAVKGGPVIPIVNDVQAHSWGQFAGDQLFVQTNWKAPKGRVVAVDLAKPSRDNWREVIPEGAASLESVSLIGGKLVVDYTENASTRLRIFEPSGKPVRDVDLPAIGSAGLGGRWESNEAFLSFTSFHMPASNYRYNLATHSKEIWSRVEAPVQSEKFEVKQVWYASKDGAKVPMFLVYEKGLKRDGARPVYLTGYGGFSSSMTPAFTSIAVLFAEHGGIYALPSLRGGGEFGEAWHQAGMRDKKQNVFDDFIGAAEWLIKNGYTSPSKLAIAGGSNGGLLVGAALTQRPDLFQAVICTYPLLDMVRYHKFSIARVWTPEYGSPDQPDQFKYLYAYSPYHHVKPGVKYPAVLFVTGDGDTRVDPLHARKMAPLLQAATASDRPVLIRYETKAGHSGGRPLNKIISDLTNDLAFLFWQLGVQLK